MVLARVEIKQGAELLKKPNKEGTNLESGKVEKLWKWLRRTWMRCAADIELRL